MFKLSTLMASTLQCKVYSAQYLFGGLLYPWAEKFKVCDVFCRYGQRKQTGQVGRSSQADREPG